MEKKQLEDLIEIERRLIIEEEMLEKEVVMEDKEMEKRILMLRLKMWRLGKEITYLKEKIWKKLN